ncbi:MAG: cation diffusion facilitator family transporter [Candidatus Omnitrophica bacterium]|nr:cation diffusion facilitator family transporter [Candidatus Omnitrophota bacterium]
MTRAGKPKALRVILSALVADVVVAVTKFIAAGLSGSAAMFAEALHSLADSVNQVLLLVGHSRASRPPDEAHPFGYGKERFFWPFVVSVVIFSIGAVFSFIRGFQQVVSPHPLERFDLNYAILAGAFVLDGAAWVIAWQELHRAGQRGRSVFKLLKESKMVSVVTVFLEDAAAVIGVLIAAAGIAWAQFTKSWMLDGAASILIGFLLLMISWFIAVETKSLLIGESASKEHIGKIKQAIACIPEVEGVLDLLTMHLGPEQILVNLDLQFRDGLTTDEIETAIDHIERRIHEAVPEVYKIFVEAESVKKAIHRS